MQTGHGEDFVSPTAARWMTEGSTSGANHTLELYFRTIHQPAESQKQGKTLRRWNLEVKEYTG